MRNNLLSILLFSLIFNIVNAQSCYEIQNISFLPEYPCQGEEVFMVVENSLCAICDCEADSIGYNFFTAFPPYIESHYYGSECDFACLSYDTIPVGIMPYGNFIFNYSLVIDSVLEDFELVEIVNCNSYNNPNTIIDTAYIINENICVGDSLQLIVELYTSAACSCNSDSSFLNLSGVVPQLNSYYNFGLCAATCNSIDTFNIGVWEEGLYTLQFNALSGYVSTLLNTYDITYEVENCVNFVDVYLDSNINIFPNPTADLFEITGLTGDYNINILDASGNIYQNINGNVSNYIIDLSSLPNGLFIISIEQNNNVIIKLEKIIKY